jgi:hypothetical protein
MEEPKYVIKQENGDVVLRSCELVNTLAPTGIKITFVTLSRMGITKRWFFDFLNSIDKTTDEYQIDGKIYNAFRDSGNVYLKETRGNIASIVGFTSGEIQKVIDEFQQG